MKTDKLYGLLLAVPPLLGAIYIFIFGVNVAFWDEVKLIPLVSSGHFPQFHDLFAQHNEHRIFFPVIVYYFIAKLTSMNSIAVMYASWLLTCLLYMLFTDYIYKTHNSNKIKFCISLLIGIFLFHPMQHENILWGFQIGFCMVYVFSILSIYFFFNNIRNNTYYVLSIACAIVASFSSIQGLLVWIAIAIFWFFLHHEDKKQLRIKFYIFAATGLLVWIIYFWDYKKPLSHHAVSVLLGKPLSFFNFFLTLLGSPYGIPNLGLPYLQGTIIVLCLFFILFCFFTNCNQRRNLKDFFLYSLILYAFIVLASISIGRAEFGAENALASRYTTFSLLLFIGIIIYFIESYHKITGYFWKKCFFYCILFLTLIVVFVKIPLGIMSTHKTWKGRMMYKYNVQHFSEQNRQVLIFIYPDPDFAKTNIQLMQSLGYNAFSGEIISKEQIEKFIFGKPHILSPVGNVEQKICEGKVDYIVHGKPIYTVHGWLVHSLDEKQSADNIITIASHDSNSLSYYKNDFVARYDIAKKYDAKNFILSGFSVYIPIGREYTIGYKRDNTVYECVNLKFKK